MARPPRLCWVYKPWHEYKYLPRPKYGRMQYDYEEMEATPEKFPYKLDGQPPKLWVAWLYRMPKNVDAKMRQQIVELFGGDLVKQVNKMKIFKNTPYWNNLLWSAKSFIEIRPITFPNGEPTDADINHTTILSSGECVVDKTLSVDETQLTTKPGDDWRHFPYGYIPSKLLSRWYSCREVQEDDVWSDPNTSRW